MRLSLEPRQPPTERNCAMALKAARLSVATARWPSCSARVSVRYLSHTVPLDWPDSLRRT